MVEVGPDIARAWRIPAGRRSFFLQLGLGQLDQFFQQLNLVVQMGGLQAHFLRGLDPVT
jgi:hypothetical protein